MLTFTQSCITREEALELPRIAQNIERQSNDFSSTFLLQHELMVLNSRLAKALNFTSPELTTPELTRAEICQVADQLVGLLTQAKAL